MAASSLTQAKAWREWARAWREKAAALPDNPPQQRALFVELAEGYEKLATQYEQRARLASASDAVIRSPPREAESLLVRARSLRLFAASLPRGDEMSRHLLEFADGLETQAALLMLKDQDNR